MGHGKDWTRSEEQRLKELYREGMAISLIAFTLRRTKKSVEYKLSSLQIRNRRKPMTAKQVRLLNRYFRGGFTRSRLAKLFKRDIKTITRLLEGEL